MFVDYHPHHGPRHLGLKKCPGVFVELASSAGGIKFQHSSRKPVGFQEIAIAVP